MVPTERRVFLKIERSQESAKFEGRRENGGRQKNEDAEALELNTAESGHTLAVRIYGRE